MKTLAEYWRLIDGALIPADSDPEAAKLARRSFYVGAAAVLQIIEESADVGIARAAMTVECEAFSRDITEGKA